MDDSKVQSKPDDVTEHNQWTMTIVSFIQERLNCIIPRTRTSSRRSGDGDGKDVYVKKHHPCNYTGSRCCRGDDFSEDKDSVATSSSHDKKLTKKISLSSEESDRYETSKSSEDRKDVIVIVYYPCSCSGNSCCNLNWNTATMVEGQQPSRMENSALINCISCVCTCCNRIRCCGSGSESVCRCSPEQRLPQQSAAITNQPGRTTDSEAG